MQNFELDTKTYEDTQKRLITLGSEVEKNLQLSARVVTALKAKGLYITAVESCTGGALANAISDIPGASDVMKDAFVTYSNESKIALGVPKDIIETYTVYSEETALAMAEAGQKKSIKADVSVGITGSISRPDPHNPNSTPGTIYLAIKFKDNSISRQLRVTGGNRFEVKQKIIAEVLSAILTSIAD